MIITGKSPNAHRTRLIDAAGNDLTKQYCVDQFNTETGELFYRTKKRAGAHIELGCLQYKVVTGVKVIVDPDKQYELGL